ncbi:lipase member H-A-like [Frankliniella occidentalis]|uniref:Lipase member H-A-like n=1 Tax=Frankliniella occidentalis TaxID=133901 RepID=A0A9C6U9V3_FRAOC|nr:lipase member H-A-like [Frankliniella occidentalis]
MSLPSGPRLLLLGLAMVAAGISGGSATFRAGRATLPRAELLKTIKLRIYGSSTADFAEYLLESQADGLLKDPRFNANKPTVLYYHGYTEHGDKESVQTVMSAFIRQAKFNVVFVDWSKVAAEFYVIPLLLVPEVAKLVAKQLDAWHAGRQLAIDSLYLVGHSLGGQAAGLTGKNLRNGKVPRVTALDPALPGFNVKSLTTNHIAPSDAHFVDVIHTDGGNYGVQYATGDADFYPNGGRRLQPGCTPNARALSDEDFCSHWRSWRFFAESLDPELPPYVGVECASYDDFAAGKCEDNKKAIMGFNTPVSTRGSFYLETSDSRPFSKAELGLRSSRAPRRMVARKMIPRRRFFWFL